MCTNISDEKRSLFAPVDLSIAIIIYVQIGYRAEGKPWDINRG